MRSGQKVAKTIDEYLERVPPDKRAALQRLRRTIQAAAPKATEAIGYGLPGFRLDGKALVWFGAAARHCAFYPGGTIHGFARELAPWETSKGTIRFPVERPLPAALVRRIVKARIAQMAAGRKASR